MLGGIFLQLNFILSFNMLVFTLLLVHNFFFFPPFFQVILYWSYAYLSFLDPGKMILNKSHMPKVMMRVPWLTFSFYAAWWTVKISLASLLMLVFLVPREFSRKKLWFWKKTDTLRCKKLIWNKNREVWYSRRQNLGSRNQTVQWLAIMDRQQQWAIAREWYPYVSSYVET